MYSMADWINNPATWVIAAAAVVGAIFAAGGWFVAVNSDRKSFSEFMKEIKDDIKEVRKDIKKIFQQLPSKVVYSGSPLQLTDFGKRISECLTSGLIVDNLISAVRGRKKDKSSYDIQELCFDYVKNEWKVPDEIESLIRECAYENGTDRKQVLDVIAVELRDRLLSSPAS